MMGDVLWDEVGREVFSIGFTSYHGSHAWAGVPEVEPMTIVSDQSPLAEFEELMAGTGHDFAFVNLRSAANEGSWLGSTFVARPLFHVAQAGVWSKSLDALFFIRDQEASRSREAGR